MNLGNVAKTGLAVVTSEVVKKQGKIIIGELLTKLSNKLSDHNSLKADIDELNSKVYELAEYYDNELESLKKKSRRNLILVSVLGGIGIVAAIVLAIVL